VLVLLLLALPARTLADSITFSELPTQPANGLTFLGVTFGFRIGVLDSPDARFNAEVPAGLAFIQGAALEGTTLGTLTLDFAAPTPLLQFGVALSSFDALTSGITVELFDATLQPLGVFTLNTTPGLSFSEGQFSFFGVPVGRAVINFNPAAARFAIDNLTFTPVPEPATLLLLGIGALGLVASRQRRRK
jgi:hypothetical protein